jgi:hypothetical protein
VPNVPEPAVPEEPRVPGGPGTPARPAPDERAPGPRGGRDVRRLTVDPQGPLLVEGPVEVTLPDGTTARSDRFLVAVCTCRRSRRYPWCDTSHRRRTREKPPGGTAD